VGHSIYYKQIFTHLASLDLLLPVGGAPRVQSYAASRHIMNAASSPRYSLCSIAIRSRLYDLSVIDLNEAWLHAVEVGERFACLASF
jgi:hypothetical protein